MSMTPAIEGAFTSVHVSRFVRRRGGPGEDHNRVVERAIAAVAAQSPADALTIQGLIVELKATSDLLERTRRCADRRARWRAPRRVDADRAPV